MNAEQIKHFVATFKAPTTLIEAVRVFADPNTSLMFMASLRWPNEVCCPRCGSIRVRYIQTRRVWECREDHDCKRFSVKTGTVMEESPLPLDKWAVAMWLEANAKNSISSYELHRALGITQKSAWFMLHRIRFALQQGSIEGKFTGAVEADETFVGGLSKNMHKDRRDRTIRGTGSHGKTIVMGLLERHSEKGKSKVRTKVIENTERKTLHGEINKHVEPGSNVYTDAWMPYRRMEGYAHEFIDHMEAYVRGAVHTNGLENFWALLKRCIKGTHVAVEPFHLSAYVNSEAFRFNQRGYTDGERFVQVMKSVEGKRLTYKSLIGQDIDAKGSLY
jgi:transposase-like protein